jgi:hypothetical protein
MIVVKATRADCDTRLFLNSQSPSISRVTQSSKIVNLQYRYVAPAEPDSLLGPDGETLQGPGGETLQSP